MARLLCIPCLILASAWLSPARADDDLKALIDKAVKAHGGEEKINKFAAAQIKAKGTVETMGVTIEVRQETSFAQPNKLRQVTDLDVAGQKISITAVSDGKQIWIKANGMDVEPTDEMKKSFKDAGHMIEVMRLTTLKGKGFKLSALGETKVLNKPAVGVKVSKEGFNDINLYFDKENHMLVRVDVRIFDQGAGMEVDEERTIAEYGKSEGLPVPKKIIITREGKKFGELEVTEYKVLEKLDDSHFAKP